MTSNNGSKVSDISCNPQIMDYSYQQPLLCKVQFN